MGTYWGGFLLFTMGTPLTKPKQIDANFNGSYNIVSTKNQR
ncbi:hypothetical protein FAES_0696 [Fibrella aestuarina BUZ 2]|uniref:Uncharacterized protein n=1 Tax=Fibrella aestuarina BUZ 2 TaxID=1166018 RepID=I0K3K4_9BACT|nr:hypothetical protein FAES_0696 [Fibrella aestuarina BUZ 2]